MNRSRFLFPPQSIYPPLLLIGKKKKSGFFGSSIYFLVINTTIERLVGGTITLSFMIEYGKVAQVKVHLPSIYLISFLQTVIP